MLTGVEATLFFNFLIMAIEKGPQIIEAMKNSELSADDKNALIARIRAAQAKVPEWI